MATRAQIKASGKYDAAHTKRVYIKLNKTSDSDILEFLEKIPNKQGYIKELIREKIKEETGE